MFTHQEYTILNLETLMLIIRTKKGARNIPKHAKHTILKMSRHLIKQEDEISVRYRKIEQND